MASEETVSVPTIRPVKPLTGVVFDLDDTLVVSTVDFQKFKRLVVDRIEGFGDDRSHYRANETIVAILDRFERRSREKGVADGEIRRMLAELDRIMDKVELERVEETVVIPGAAEILTYLRGRGVKVGVLTRGCEAYARKAMTRTGLDGLVDAIECRNSHTRPKPYPDSYLRLVAALGLAKDETLFVGDHAIDAKCARNAGVPFIGVGTGDVPEEELADEGAFMWVADIAELRERLGPYLID